MLDRLTRSWVLRLSRLEEVKNVLRARCRPKCEELVIRIGEGPTAADRHEARVSDLREDHGWHSLQLTAYRLGSDRGSPNHESTLLSKRVMAQIWSPVRVRTYRPVPWRTPVAARR
jgi:hypothetical protein